MEITVTINTDNLLEHTSRQQDEAIGNQFCVNASDDALISEVQSRRLFDELLSIIPDEMIISRAQELTE